MLPHPHDADAELVRRCLAGEPAAWERFVLLHQPLLEGVVRRTLSRFGALPDAPLVQDILQDIWVTVLRGESAVLKRFDWRRPLKVLLGTVAVSRTIDHLRRRRPDLSLENPAVSAAVHAGEGLESDETAQRVEKALARLSPQEQAVLKLFYWRGFPVQGIGRILKLQPGTVRSVLAHGRGKLREILSRLPLLLF